MSRCPTALVLAAAMCFALPVLAGVHVADFEDLGLAAGAYGNGSDLCGGFVSRSVHFSNRYNPAWGSWGGFASSRVSDTNTAGYGNQYAVFSGSGRNGGAYAVVHDDQWNPDTDVVTLPLPCCVTGFYINNTTYAALSMLRGDGFAKQFGGPAGSDPDWFKLTITGRDASGSGTGSVDVYLADYRFADDHHDYIVREWTWVDLTPLGGNVQALHFSMTSSDSGAWGMNTPAYFAMDDLQCAPRPVPSCADLDALVPVTNGYWNGSCNAGGFLSQGAWFSNSYNAAWESWSGFAYSRVNDTSTPGRENQYAVFSGTDVSGTGTYAVGFDSSWEEADVVTLFRPSFVEGLYVNNTTYTALSMRDGDGFAKQFGGAGGSDPDWFKLRITGRNPDGAETGFVDVYLADYRFSNPAQDYIINAWTWVDLSGLGPDVKTLHFGLSSTDNGAWGMNTPAYYALDGLRTRPSFADYDGDGNPWDAGVPGFVGPAGEGKVGGANVLNPAFCGWADRVVNYAPAPGVEIDWSDTSKALGEVTGFQTNVTSLGDLDQSQISTGAVPGEITLGVSVPIADEAGPDFVVFENGFTEEGTHQVFAELGFVEVSSDGTNFARFPGISYRTTPVDAYETTDAREIYNLCGKHANGYGRSWGTPFDLSDIACHALVQDGTVCLTNITHVRIVDIPGSGDVDDSQSPPNGIRDPWLTEGSGGVDVEAVGVINSPSAARILTWAGVHGSISPSGAPQGLVSVRNGDSATFTITPDPGFHVADVRINGTSIGRASGHTFTNVTCDQTITAVFGHRLVVESPYGVCDPPRGTNVTLGDVFCTVQGWPVENGATQIVCAGWAGEGSTPATGSAAVTATFELTNDTRVTWLWATNLSLSAVPEWGGSVESPQGWVGRGSVVTSRAVADPFYTFTGWSGDTQGDTNALLMPLTMDRPRQVTAHFDTDVATNGTPIPWLEFYGLTNGARHRAALSDDDEDGAPAWKEFFAGTDPGRPESVFRITAHGVANGSNYVVWLGGTNGSAAPFVVYAAPAVTGAWQEVGGPLTHRASGTNTWWGELAGSNVYYRIGVALPPL